MEISVRNPLHDNRLKLVYLKMRYHLKATSVYLSMKSVQLLESLQLLTFTALQELDTLLYHLVFHHDHVFGHVLDQRQEAALGVVPRVRPQFLVVGLQGFNHAGNSELIVTLGAIQSSTKTGLNFKKKICFIQISKKQHRQERMLQITSASYCFNKRKITSIYNFSPLGLNK